VPAYWEEHLANEDPENGVSFQIGNVKMIGRSLRARCNVPPRNPLTGETDKTFVKRMIASRQENIPSWSQISKMDSLYHFSVDTYIPISEVGKEIKIGDLVQLL
jgi:uncharacterized protein YcbX